VEQKEKDEKVLRQMRKKRLKLSFVDLHKKHFSRERRKEKKRKEKKRKGRF
jgi:hypothetical protein